MGDEQFKMTKEEFRNALSRVMKKGLDAVLYGFLPRGDMIEVLDRIKPMIEALMVVEIEPIKGNVRLPNLRDF